MARRLGAAVPGIEVEVRHGGQPFYRYLISADRRGQGDAPGTGTVPTDPVELLSTPLADPGWRPEPRFAGPASSSTSTRSATCSSTCPGATTTCARCGSWATCGSSADGDVISAQARSVTSASSPGSVAGPSEPSPGSRTTRAHRRHLVRPTLHRTPAPVGAEVVVSGKLKHFGRKLTLDNPEFQVLAESTTELLHAGRIVPVYPLTAGLTRHPPARGHPRGARQGRLCLSGVPPGRGRRGGRPRAHRPGDRGGPLSGVVPGSRCRAPPARLRRTPGAPARHGRAATAARPRRRAADRHDDAVGDAAVRAAIVDAIGSRVGEPIELTVDQSVAIDAIRDDLARPTPMLRLLQGDVGSGKTAVAAYALAARARAGLQGALLAPTDLLARQHLETSAPCSRASGIGVTLLTGSLKADVEGQGARGDRVGTGAGRGRHPRAHPGRRLVRRPRPRRHRRAAPLRRRPARRARGQGRRRARRTSC